MCNIRVRNLGTLNTAFFDIFTMNKAAKKVRNLFYCLHEGFEKYSICFLIQAIMIFSVTAKFCIIYVGLD